MTNQQKKGSTITMADDLAKAKKSGSVIELLENSAAVSRFNEKLRQGFGLLSNTSGTARPIIPPRPENRGKITAPSPTMGPVKIQVNAPAAAAASPPKESPKLLPSPHAQTQIPDKAAPAKEGLIGSEKKQTALPPKQEKQADGKQGVMAQKAAPTAEPQKDLAADKQEKERREREKTLEEKKRRLAQLAAEQQRKIVQDRQQKEREAAMKNTTPKEPLSENSGIGNDLAATLRQLIVKLKDKRAALEKHILGAAGIKAPLERKKIELESRIAEIKNGELRAVESREQEIEKQESEEKQRTERKMDARQEKLLEQKLWAIEDQRKEIEQQRWEVEDKIEKIELEIKKTELEINQKENEAAAMRRNCKIIGSQEKLVRFALEKGKLEEEILAAAKEEEEMKPLLDKAVERKNAATKKLAELAEKEKAVRQELEATEEQEKQAIDPSAKRTIEQSRWRTSSNLKTITQAKWENQDSVKQAEVNEQNLRSQISAIQTRINKLQNAISSNEAVLENEDMPVHNLRDAIAELINSYGLSLDPERLKEIIQPDDLKEMLPPTTAAPVEAASWAQKEAAPPANQPRPETKPVQPSMADNKTEKSEPIEAKFEKKPDLPKNLPLEKPAQGAPASNKPVLTPEQTQTAAKPSQPLNPPVTNSHNQTLAPEVIRPLPADTVKNDLPEPAEEKPLPQKSLAEKPLPPKETPAAESTATPEIGTTKPATPAKIQTAAAPDKNAPGIVYREPTDKIFPATNIPAFREREIGHKAVAPTADIQKLPPALVSPVKNNTDSAAEIAAKPAPASEAWGDRLAQIKKANVPAPNPEIAAEIATKPPVIENFPAKSGRNNNLIIRILVLLLAVGIIGIVFVLVFSKTSSPTPVKTKPTPTGNNTTTPTNTDTGEKTTKQTPMLATISTIPIYADNLANVPNLLYPYLNSSLDANGYYQVSIQNKKDNSYVNLRQFLDIFGINVPFEFYDTVNNDCIIYIYANNGKNRLGFVANVSDAAKLKTVMSVWEPNLAQDTDFLFKSLGKKTQPANTTPSFKNKIAANGTGYRSLPFPPESADLSLNYTVYNSKYLIFATSSESMAKIFDQLPK